MQRGPQPRQAFFQAAGVVAQRVDFGDEALHQSAAGQHRRFLAQVLHPVGGQPPGHLALEAEQAARQGFRALGGGVAHQPRQVLGGVPLQAAQQAADGGGQFGVAAELDVVQRGVAPGHRRQRGGVLEADGGFRLALAGGQPAFIGEHAGHLQRRQRHGDAPSGVRGQFRPHRRVLVQQVVECGYLDAHALSPP